MSEWIEAVFDRTSADVTRAKRQVQEWIKALSEGREVTITDLKGYFNASDLNRIENNTLFLAEPSVLTLEIKTDWNTHDLPTQEDLDRVIGNITQLIDHFELGDAVYEMPTTILTYKHANVIEHNLYLIKTLLEDISNRVQGFFERVEGVCQIGIKMAMTIPIKGINVDLGIGELFADPVFANSFPVKFDLDSIVITFESKPVNAHSLPFSFRTRVDYILAGKVTNGKPLPLIMTYLEECGMRCKVTNGKPYPIIAEMNVADTAFMAKMMLIDSTWFTIFNTFIPYALTECAVGLLKSEDVKSSVIPVEGEMSADARLADMLIEALFDSVVMGAQARMSMIKMVELQASFDRVVEDDNAEASIIETNRIKALFDRVDAALNADAAMILMNDIKASSERCVIGSAIKIGFYVPATIGDYADYTLESVGDLTLYELSIIERNK